MPTFNVEISAFEILALVNPNFDEKTRHRFFPAFHKQHPGMPSK
jgi:hypothetical protein